VLGLISQVDKMHPEPGQRIATVVADRVGRRSPCDGRSTILFNSGACHEYVRCGDSRDAGTLPAEGHGMSGAPSDFLLHIGNELFPILRQILDATIVAIVASFQIFGRDCWVTKL
jgi:hypothetical protein